MAHIYVYSGAAGAGTGADWTNAYTTLKAAAEAAGTAAGDSIWAAHDHNETGAVALTITCKNTKAAPGTIACVNRAGSVPPVAADLATTATVTTTGGNGITLNGVGDGPTLWQGITFNCGTGAVTNFLSLGSASIVNYFKNCNFKKLGTTASTTAIDAAGKHILDNCTVQFGATGDSMRLPGSRFEWVNSPNAIAGATFPVTLFATALSDTEVVLRGVDLSAFTGTLFIAINTASARDMKLINCKLSAGVTVSASQNIVAGGRVTLINCDSGPTSYRTEYYRFGGNQVIETIIVHTGGASDGTTQIAWKIVTDTNSRWLEPFESLPITVWSDTTGAKTVSIYGYWSNASAPNNDDIWIEVEGLTTAGFPISTIASSGKTSFLATGASVPADTSAWGAGATVRGNSTAYVLGNAIRLASNPGRVFFCTVAGTTAGSEPGGYATAVDGGTISDGTATFLAGWRVKMSASLTTAMKGPITVRVKVAKASSTFYIDPKIEVV